MSDKKSINKKEIIQKQTSDVLPLVERKIEFFKEIHPLALCNPDC